MSKKVTLKNTDGEVLYPETHASQIIGLDITNIPTSDSISSIQDQLTSLDDRIYSLENSGDSSVTEDTVNSLIEQATDSIDNELSTINSQIEDINSDLDSLSSTVDSLSSTVDNMDLSSLEATIDHALHDLVNGYWSYGDTEALPDQIDALDDRVESIESALNAVNVSELYDSIGSIGNIVSAMQDSACGPVWSGYNSDNTQYLVQKVDYLIETALTTDSLSDAVHNLADDYDYKNDICNIIFYDENYQLRDAVTNTLNELNSVYSWTQNNPISNDVLPTIFKAVNETNCANYNDRYADLTAGNNFWMSATDDSNNEVSAIKAFMNVVANTLNSNPENADNYGKTFTLQLTVNEDGSKTFNWVEVN